MGFKSRQVICIVSLLLWAFVASFASDETVAEHDNSRISVFVQPSISFLSFDQRDYFQDAVDTIYKEFRANALDESESLNVAKQSFQKVNFCFPIYGGLQFQLMDDQFLSAGIGFIYDNESVVLSDRKSKSHNYSYTIQGVPLFLEYRLAIPLNLMTLSDGGLFSVALRWYWTMPGTEIYTTWGKIGAENSPFGAGFGISIGYLIASWHGINVFGDIGYSSISVESKKSFADIVPDGPEEKAKWNIGGLQLQIRVGFGLWNKPKPKDPADSTATANADSTANAGKESAADSSSVNAGENHIADSTAANAGMESVADTSATADSTVANAGKNIPADSSTATQDSTAATRDSTAATKDSIASANSTAAVDSAAATKDSTATATKTEDAKAPVKDKQPATESASSDKVGAKTDVQNSGNNSAKTSVKDSAKDNAKDSASQAPATQESKPVKK